jgi:hypothetical protein
VDRVEAEVVGFLQQAAKLEPQGSDPQPRRRIALTPVQCVVER